MPKEKKYIATGLLILTILIVIFLASSISGVEFQPVTPIASDRAQSKYEPPTFPQISPALFDFVLMFILWVVLPLSIFFFIKYPDFRQKFLKRLGYFVLYGVILFLLGRKTQKPSPELEEAEQEIINTTILETQREAAEFISSFGEADPKLNIVINITILLAVSVLAWYLYRRFFYKPDSTADQLKAEVEGAINEIESGVDLRNVIIRCYADMSQILMDRRGIQRQKAMTPREFELELQEIGLPQIAIQRLTSLFEAVRYGNAQLDSEAEQEAIHCLTTIAEAC
jgi:hypothetical protein